MSNVKNILLSKIACLFFILINISTNRVFSQDTIYQGIKFDDTISWQQAIIRASAENKLIFVDCYTTWCIPCKKMDQNVYPQKQLGEFFNERFVSVKFQMDTTARDKNFIKRHYADARNIMRLYNVDAFPTLLFFTPEGKLLSKSVGGQDVDGLLKLASDAINPENNYYTFLDEYKQGKRDYQKIGIMAVTALRLKDTITGNKLAKDYLLNVKKSEIFTKNGIDFLVVFTRATSDPGFKLFIKNTDKINNIVGNSGFSQKVIQSAIYRSYVAPMLAKAAERNENPDFVALNNSIKKQFGAYYSERVVTSSKFSWYHKNKNFNAYTKNLVHYFDKYEFPNFPIFLNSNSSIDDLILNNYAWEVFKYSNDKEELTKALAWSNRAVMMRASANWMDTYANILYKLGKIELAVQWQTIASQVDPKDVSIQQTLEKMKKGLPTWPTK